MVLLKDSQSFNYELQSIMLFSQLFHMTLSILSLWIFAFICLVLLINVFQPNKVVKTKCSPSILSQTFFISHEFEIALSIWKIQKDKCELFFSVFFPNVNGQNFGIFSPFCSFSKLEKQSKKMVHEPSWYNIHLLSPMVGDLLVLFNYDEIIPLLSFLAFESMGGAGRFFH